MQSRGSGSRARRCVGVLVGLVVQHLTVVRVAQAPAVAWHTANDAVLAEDHRVLIDDPHRFENGVGVDEHVWRHARCGVKCLRLASTEPRVRKRRRPARVLDMVEGGSNSTFKQWFAARLEGLARQRGGVAMDGFTGLETTTVEELTRGLVRRRKSTLRLRPPGPSTSAWSPPAATGDRTQGRALMNSVIDTLSRGGPAALGELVTIVRTLKKCAADVLAFFDVLGTSNGPTVAFNRRLEHLRGSALGFRNLTHYIARSLLKAGGFSPLLHPHLR